MCPAQVTGEHTWSYSDRLKFTDKLAAAASLSSSIYKRKDVQVASAVGASRGLERSSATGML